MFLTEYDLLRLHIEAVWDVQLPPLMGSDCELLPTGHQPSWQLYAADVADRRIHIWRPDVTAGEREVLRLNVGEALIFPPMTASLAGVSREVACAFSALPALDLASAQKIARPLDIQDRSLIESFQTNSDLLDPARSPLIGVVEAGRLLCLAHSSRRTAAACESGIDTLPSARRRGYALAAIVLWTQAILQEGLVPLYSLLAENTPSLHLAAKAGYRAFAHGATFYREKDMPMIEE